MIGQTVETELVIRIYETKIPRNISPGLVSLKYFDSFLRACYYFGICPTKFHRSSNDNNYRSDHNWFQMGTCIMYAILTFLIRIAELREMKEKAKVVIPRKHELEPEEYFLLARTTGILFYAWAIAHTFWFNTTDIVNQLNLANQYCKKIGNERRKYRVRSPNWLGRNQVELWLMITALYTMTSLIIPYLEDVISCAWNFEAVFEKWSRNGRELLFVPMTTTNSTLTAWEKSKIDIAFTVFNVLALYADNVFLSLGDMFLVICALLILVYFQEFETELENISRENQINVAVQGHTSNGGECQTPSNHNFDFPAILEEYDMILELVNGLNRVIGLLVLGQTLGALPFFVTDFLHLLNPPSTLVLIRVLLYFGSLFVFIILAAMVNQKAQAFENWMSQRQNYLLVEKSGGTIGVKEMIAIQQGNNVGISAGRFFVITSEFIGSWISLLLTFVIVILEFRSS